MNVNAHAHNFIRRYIYTDELLYFTWLNGINWAGNRGKSKKVVPDKCSEKIIRSRRKRARLFQRFTEKTVLY